MKDKSGQQTKLSVKNMVCHRCVLAVEDILQKEKIPYVKVLIGEIYLMGDITPGQRETLDKKLEEVGLGLIDGHAWVLIEKVKKLIISRVQKGKEAEPKNKKLSDYLSSHLHHEYTYLSSLFSSIEGRTIESFFIEQRIEKAKELIVYGQMTLSQIAFELEFSSAAHLSGQFKKISGLSPSYFKKVGDNRRKSLDKV